MMNPRVVYEDNHLLVVIKPPNLLSQGDQTGDADLLTLMKAYIKEKYQKPGDVYLGLVHRMDRPVGGLLCLARTGKAASRLSAQAASHAMGRTYLAVVEGHTPEEGTLRDFLLKDSDANRVTVVPEGTAGSKSAVLHYTRLQADDTASLVAITLETGRAHQIRVQMTHAGYPLAGDARYGDGKPGRQIALWGAVLTLEHPTKKERMTFASTPEGSEWGAFENSISRFFDGYDTQGEGHE